MKHPFDVRLGDNIRLTRQMRGMTQEDLAGKLGITYQQLQKYEKAENRISASRLYDLAHILGVSVDYFYGKTNPTPMDKVIASFVVTFSKLSPKQQKLIVKIMKEF